MKQLLEELETQIAFESSKDLSGKWTPEYREGFVDGLKRAHELTNAHFAGAFSITSVHRDDLTSIGYDPSSVDDDTMARIAERMGEYMTESGAFWDVLETLASEFAIPKKAITQEAEEAGFKSEPLK